jgi:hypothetical protein
LHAKGADRLDLARVRQADIPTHAGEPVADPDGAAHHLDAPANLVAVERQRQPGKAVLVGGDHALLKRAVLVERAPARAPGSPVDPEILHAVLLASKR